MNFEKLFKDYKLDYSTKTNRGWVNLHCPYCGGSSYKLGFNPSGDYCTCFACGGHNLRKTLSIVLSVPQNQLDDVLIQYQGRSGILYELNNKKTPKAIKLDLPDNGFTKAERKYLLKRNFYPRLLHEKYGVTGGGMTGKWKYRIIIPLIVGGRVVSWTARSILSKNEVDELKIPRYKNLSVEDSVIDCKRTLFNLDNSTRDKVILTEGCFDVMRFGDDTICSFGTTLTEEQLKVIQQRFKRVFILFDDEPEAQMKARKYGLQISAMGCEVEIVNAYSDYGVNDGAELTDEQVIEIKKELGVFYNK